MSSKPRAVNIPPVQVGDTMQPLRATVAPQDAGPAQVMPDMMAKMQGLVDSGIVPSNVASAMLDCAVVPQAAAPQAAPVAMELKLRPDVILEGDPTEEELRALLPSVNWAKRVVKHTYPEKESKPAPTFQMDF